MDVNKGLITVFQKTKSKSQKYIPNPKSQKLGKTAEELCVVSERHPLLYAFSALRAVFFAVQGVRLQCVGAIETVM